MTTIKNATLLFISFMCLFVACEKPVKNTKEMYSIIPFPQELKIKDGGFYLNKETKFNIQKDIDKLKKESTVFRDIIKKRLGFNLEVTTGKQTKKNYIALKIDTELESDEAYTLVIEEKAIHISGGSEKGVFNALQSLRQLLAIDGFEEGKNFEPIAIPCAEIKDTPRYGWRGVMVDESRHFFGKEKIKQLLELMAFQKLNKFHWHLTDAPGWRIEIKKYPKLTSIGAKGNFSNPNAPAQFYTQQDIKEIIRFAGERNIEVIPEIDMPGHASAAMRAYPEYSGGGTEKHPHFTFHPARIATYGFLTDVLKEVANLFPSKYIHIGADEVSFGNKHWAKDKEVMALMRKEKLKNIKEVETYFINRIRDSILVLNKEVMGWDEVVENNMNSEKTVAMWWRHDKVEVLKKGLKNNYKMILCPRRPLYFDFVQHESHKFGRRWGGFCSVDGVYEFPDSLEEIVVDTPQILGVQANLWTEQIDTEDKFDYMLYPRLSALAEAAWTKKENKSFEDFKPRLKKILEVYRADGIYYFDYFSPEKTKEPGSILSASWQKNFSTYKN